MSIEAMKHYEAALMAAFPHGGVGKVFEHWSKARQAIEKAEKPMAWMLSDVEKPSRLLFQKPSEQHRKAYSQVDELYTAPQQREWVELTPYQFDQLEQLFGHTVPNDFVLADIVCTVESKLKENNQ